VTARFAWGVLFVAVVRGHEPLCMRRRHLEPETNHTKTLFTFDFAGRLPNAFNKRGGDQAPPHSQPSDIRDVSP